MAGWQWHLQSLVRQVAKRYERSPSTPFSTFNQAKASLVSASELFQVIPCQASQSHYVLLFEAEGTPISSPLILALPSSTGSSETQEAICKSSKVQAVLKGIEQNPKKLNLVAALVRGMRVEDALLQLQVTVKRAAKTVYQVGDWCVAKAGAPDNKLKQFLDNACSSGASRATSLDCTLLLPGGTCFQPNTLPNHASYALNIFYKTRGDCDSDLGLILRGHATIHERCEA
ncbi:hypothetical protein C2S52_004612 [Perilla frutescens var. hirtella]|nr:hypothetical protein C2S52_004612 [Perilla frutescens var. hirtella]